MIRHVIPFAVMLCLLPGYAWCQEKQLDIEEVIAGACERDSIRRAEVGDLTMLAESYSRKLTGDGEVKEEKKFFKNYYFKDSLFKVEFLEYYLEDELQDEKELEKQIAEAIERRKKGRSRDASINPIEPFYPENRQHYRFSMPGIEKQHGCICYHIVAECLVEDENLFEGDYWFEVNWLNLAHTEFRPAKMPSKIKQMDMTMSYAPVEEGYWLPVGFHLRGRGKVLVFIKFNFEVEEKYSKHKINVGLADDFFAEDNNEN
jgi:hypothetical protein